MIRTCKSRLTRFIAISALLLTAGCAVGPRFKRPAAPDVGGYTPAPMVRFLRENTKNKAKSGKKRRDRRSTSVVR
jgi:hypothetical protein